MPRTLSTKTNRTFVTRMMPGEDILKTIELLVSKENISAGQLSLIGAVGKATLGYFDRVSKQYKSFTINEDLEVVSCMGNISKTKDGSPVVHAHMIVADEKGKCYGGHLMPGCEVSVTIEMVINVFDGEMIRAKDPETGLNLLDIK
ncbi:MAG: PPC domain-containing DNA-binding protein [Candidatus Thorarchaeota archaeon]